MQDSVRDGLREIGNVFTLESIAKTRELLTQHALVPAAVGAVVERDLSYGPHARHRLDVFHAAAAGPARPVVMYVHGGGFAAGDKGGAETPFFNNVGAWAVRAGFVGVTMTYRYAPEHRWPSGAMDVGAALEWLRANVARFHGDASRVVLIGHSAGAAHVSGCLTGQGGAISQPPAAAILISGVYEPDAFDSNPMHQVYYGTDRGEYASRSVVPGLAATTVPCLFTISQFDPVQFQRQLSIVFSERVARSGRCPEVLYLPEHNHVSPAMYLGCDGDELGNQLAGYVRRMLGT